MATAIERARLRRDIGADQSALPDSEADLIFVESAETYTTGSSAYYAYARVLALQGILASSAKMTTYRQNESQENASDVFKHLKDLLAIWERKTAQADTEDDQAAGTSSIKASKRLSRVKQYPG